MRLSDAAFDDGVLLAEKAANPATPAAGYGRLFAKADGVYFIGDSGTVVGPFGGGLSALEVPVTLGFALSDETTAITTGAAKLTAVAPFDFTLSEVIASLTTASSSGAPAFDVNDDGVSVFSTTVTIDATERSSTTAATAAVIANATIAKGSILTFDIDTAGTGATGAKVWLLGTRDLSA